MIVALSVSITVAFGSIGLFAALRTGSGEAVQSLFPVFFVFLFLSSMALPLNLIQTDWFHTVATINPVSYLLQAFRSLLIEGWNAGDLALEFAHPVVREAVYAELTAAGVRVLVPVTVGAAPLDWVEHRPGLELLQPAGARPEGRPIIGSADGVPLRSGRRTRA